MESEQFGLVSAFGLVPWWFFVFVYFLASCSPFWHSLLVNVAVNLLKSFITASQKGILYLQDFLVSESLITFSLDMAFTFFGG